MGHKGDIEARYSTNKRLPLDMIDEMREAYAKASKFFNTVENGITEDDMARIKSDTMRETAIMMLEMTLKTKLSEEQKEELMAIETAEFQDKLNEYFNQKRADIENNGNHFKTIPERELDNHLNSGWELVQIYPSGDKAIVKLP